METGVLYKTLSQAALPLFTPVATVPGVSFQLTVWEHALCQHRIDKNYEAWYFFNQS